MYFLAKELQILLCLYVKKVNQIISNCYFKDLCNATFDFLTYVKKGHFAYFYGYFIPPKIGLEKSVSKKLPLLLKKGNMESFGSKCGRCFSLNDL